MPSPLYLDTARLGRISPTAKAIQADYLRFAAARGCPSSLRDLLISGGLYWPTNLRRRYPVLSRWYGVGHLNRSLRRIAGADGRAKVLLGSRSHSHMLLAAYLLCRNCETILTSDLGWPRYHEILLEVARKLGRCLVEIPLRSLAYSNGSHTEIANVVSEAFRDSRSTGLFLPAVSHDGVELPLREIAGSVKASNELRFFAVDGAQHLAHGRARFSEMDCDFYLAGTHKWLRSLYPLGVAIYGRHRSRRMIETTVQELANIGTIDDPLLKFTSQLESAELDGVTETVNLSALLSAHGAAQDAYPACLRNRLLSIQLKNARMISDLAEKAGWQPVRPSPALRSGILLLRSPVKSSNGGRDLGNQLEAQGIVATATICGLVRLSMPRRYLSQNKLAKIQKALASIRDNSLVA